MMTQYTNCIKRLVPLLLFAAAFLLCVPTLTHADSYEPPPRIEETLPSFEPTYSEKSTEEVSEEDSETESSTEAVNDHLGESAPTESTSDLPGGDFPPTSNTIPGASIDSSLIVQCSISCKAGEAQLIIRGKTHSVKRVDEVGFRNIRIFRADKNGIWKLYDTLDDIRSVNAVSCFIDSLTVAVSDGGHFYVTCEHYAKDNGQLSTALNQSEKIIIPSVKPFYGNNSPITVTQPTQSPTTPITTNSQRIPTSPTAPASLTAACIIGSAKNTAPKQPAATSVRSSDSDSSPQTGVPTTNAWTFLIVSAACALLLKKIGDKNGNI